MPWINARSPSGVALSAGVIVAPAKYVGMTNDLQELTEIGRRRQARRFVLVASLMPLMVLAISLTVVDPTTKVGAIVLAITLPSVLVGLLLAYRFFFRVPGPELAFTGLPWRRRKDLMRRLLKGGEITDDELRVADGLLTAAKKPLLPAVFGINAVLQLALAIGRDPDWHLFSGFLYGVLLLSILDRRRRLARRTDVEDRAARQRYLTPPIT